MAGRTRRVITLEEKIENVQAKVDDLTQKLADAKNELKELKDKKAEQDLAELKKIVDQSGKSLEEVKQMLLSE